MYQEHLSVVEQNITSQKMLAPYLDNGALFAVLMQAKFAPTACAVHFLEYELSYLDLIRVVHQLRSSLKKKGVKKGDTVGVSIDRSVNLVPLLLAIWSVGAAYVPVDPRYPLDRKNYILSDANIKLLIHDASAETLEFSGERILTSQLLDHSEPFDLMDTNLAEEFKIDLASIAYIIYTSGSTGNPKGVTVSQKNVSNFLLSMSEEPGLTSNDTLLAVTTISFDIHVLELFLPLIQGGRLVLASERESKSGLQLQTLIEIHQVTIMQATPATWRMLLAQNWYPSHPLKALVGGEALPRDLVPLMLSAFSELWNMYGPTETTVWSTCYQIKSLDDPIYIGKAIRNTALYVVDELLNVVNDGDAGELLIGGDGITYGYLNKPELTKKSFIERPELGVGPIYRTGDLVIRHTNGNLEYINRIDNQIKIRGFRMEPGDIEKTVDEFDGITQSCVVAAEFEPGDQRLMCFYLGEKASLQDLTAHCSEKLPRHMLPQHFVYLKEFPKTENLKIDRKELRKIAPKSISTTTAVFGERARNNFERTIISVWEEVLGVHNMSIDDNFFLLGGHSLLALTVIEKMNRATGKHFTPDSIFTYPTIRQLLGNAQTRRQGEELTVVSKLNKNEKGIPIFCLCGMQIYSGFAKELAFTNPVFAVFGRQEIALLSGTDKRAKEFDIEKFTATYVEAIQRQHRGGPLILAGFSFGGVLSIEVSRRLKALNFKIHSVILIDSYTSDGFYRSKHKICLDAFRSIRRNGVRISFLRGCRRALNKLGKTSPETDIVTQKEREEVFDLAAEAFAPTLKPYHGDVFLMKACETDFGFGMRGKKDYGWGELINGEITIASYESDHTGIMKGAGLIYMANKIKSYLSTKSVRDK